MRQQIEQAILKAIGKHGKIVWAGARYRCGYHDALVDISVKVPKLVDEILEIIDSGTSIYTENHNGTVTRYNVMRTGTYLKLKENK